MRSSPAWRRAVPVGLVAVFTVAGCGGDDDAATTTTAAAAAPSSTTTASTTSAPPEPEAEPATTAPAVAAAHLVLGGGIDFEGTAAEVRCTHTTYDDGSQLLFVELDAPDGQRLWGLGVNVLVPVDAPVTIETTGDDATVSLAERNGTIEGTWRVGFGSGLHGPGQVTIQPDYSGTVATTVFGEGNAGGPPPADVVVTADWTCTTTSEAQG